MRCPNCSIELNLIDTQFSECYTLGDSPELHLTSKEYYACPSNCECSIKYLYILTKYMQWTPDISHANTLFGSVTQTSTVIKKLIRDESNLDVGAYAIDPETILTKKKQMLLLQGGKSNHP